MTGRLFIGLSLTLVSFMCLGQNDIPERERQAYIDAGWTYSKMDSAFVEYQVFDTIFSLDKKFKILVRAVGLSDNVKKSQYWLIRTEKKDTTELMIALRHDLPPPNFFWTSNGYLIYETDHRYGQNPKVQMHNLTTNMIDYSTVGFLPIGDRWSHQFYDRENEILIFFRPGTEKTDYKADLVALNIKEKEVKKLMTFMTKLEYEYPVVFLDPKTRKMKIKTLGFVSGETAEYNLTY